MQFGLVTRKASYNVTGRNLSPQTPVERKSDFFFYSSPELNVYFKSLLLVAET